jgi:pimeloyl-ACP methyl ester carboxylesterase
MTLYWNDNSNNEQGFKVERRNGSTWSQIGIASVNSVSFINGGLTPGTQYCFRVRAYNAGGDSGFSNETCTDNRARKTLIIVGGLNSDTAGTQSGFASIRSTVALLFDDVIQFSYNPDSDSYAAKDTYKSIWSSRDVLAARISRHLMQYPDTRFSLIGYSLGGVISLNYVAQYVFPKTQPHHGRLNTVITLDSPVNGSTYLSIRMKNDAVIVATGAMGDNPKLFGMGSQATLDLAAMGTSQANWTLLNRNAARLIKEQQGTTIMTLTNSQDRFVPMQDALISNYGKSYSLGCLTKDSLLKSPYTDLVKNFGLPRFDGCKVDNNANMGDIGGHGEILNDAKVSQDIKGILQSSFR